MNRPITSEHPDKPAIMACFKKEVGCTRVTNLTQVGAVEYRAHCLSPGDSNGFKSLGYHNVKWSRPGPEKPAAVAADNAEFGHIKTFWDHQARTCIQVDRDVQTVTFIPLDIGGFKVREMSTTKFDALYKPLDFPTRKACEQYANYAKVYGATAEVLQHLGRVVAITPEEYSMSVAKMQPKEVEKTSTKSATKAVVKSKLTAAALFQDLIMQGNHTDDTIFKKVQEKFGLDDKKRGYVAWYRNHLKKLGKKPPEAKEAK